MRPASFLLLILLLCACGADPGPAPPPGSSRTTEDGHFRITATAELEPIAINTMHDWIVRVERPDGTPVPGARVLVQGGMPEHQHGLPTAPRTTGERAPGEYVVEGMKFNMTGHWQLTFTVWSEGVTDRATFDLELE